MYLRRVSAAAALALAGVAVGMFWLSAGIRPIPQAAARTAGPPPELWSIKVWGEARPGRAIRICADGQLRAGFTSLAADFGGTPCAIASLQKHSWGQTVKFTLCDKVFGGSTTVDGARDRVFIARSSVTDLDTAETVYARALRFERLGPCPPGWPVGDATDQQGRRATAAYMDGSDLPAYPHGSLMRDG